MTAASGSTWRPSCAHRGSACTTRSPALTSSTGGTVVRLREHGYPDTPEGWAGFGERSTGWGEALTLLEVWVEHGLRY